MGKSGSSYKWVLVSEEWGGMGGKKWEELQVGAVLVSEDVGRSSAVFAQLTSIPPFMNPVNCF